VDWPALTLGITTQPEVVRGLQGVRVPAAPVSTMAELYNDEQLKALRLAYDLFECGITAERREELAASMTKEPAMKFRWFKGLVQEIRS